MKGLARVLALGWLVAGTLGASVTRLEVTTSETILKGKRFGLAGAYEKIAGRVHFRVDPLAAANQKIVDIDLAPRDEEGLVGYSADFYLLKPVDPTRSNGVLFYEAGNRGTKRILSTFQGARRSSDPSVAEDFGDGRLMEQGYSLLWMGWQWDVPDGRMRMEMPIATDDGQPIHGLVRGNFIPGIDKKRASLADRGHRGYAVVDPLSQEHVMTERRLPHDEPTRVERRRWRFVGDFEVELDGGFKKGHIYDVVYRTVAPRVVGVGLAGTRDLVSFFKYADDPSNPLAGRIDHAIGWGVSQTGRFLRHFVYEGFNADENGRIVFDGLIDQVGGGGRGSFNHRFAQASRDALQFFNIFYPVDQFPFTDETQVDPQTGKRDGLLSRALSSDTVPKFFHVLTNSEYFNRSGSLIHTDVAAERDVPPPDSSRIYFISSAPHIVGSFPPGPFGNPEFQGQAPMNPLVYTPVIRALFDALSAWVTRGLAPPESKYPRVADGTLVAPPDADWPTLSGVQIPHHPLTPVRLDFGPRFAEGIVDFEPPHPGEPFTVRVPAVDEAGNDIAGIRLPEIQHPLATHTGWNYRAIEIGSPDRLASEIGAYFPLARERDGRDPTSDSRLSIGERYRDENDYMGRVTDATLRLVDQRFLLVEDIPSILERARRHYRFAVGAEAR